MAVRKLTCLSFLFLFIITSTVYAGSTQNMEGPPYVWKVATLAPRGMGYAKQFQEILMPVILEEGGGELELKIFWGGVMGDDKEVLKKLRSGVLHSAGFSGQGTFLISPEISVLGLPFLFNGYDEVDYIKEKMIDRFDKIGRKQGLNMLLWLDQDFDQIYSSNRPMTKKEDFKNTKFATWYGPLDGSMLKRLGAEPIMTNVTDIPGVVRSGKADAVIAPSIWISGTQLYSTFRYINPMKLRYVPAFVVATNAAVEPLNEKYYKRLLELRVGLSKKFCVQARLDIIRFIDAMKEYGLACHTSSQRNLDEIRKATAPVWQDLMGDQYPKELLDEVLGHLEDFRTDNS